MSERIALVTGSSRGIGQAITTKLESMGYKVLTPTREELNLLSDLSIDQYLHKIRHITIDLLVNNAGINPLSGLLEITDDDFNNTMKVNLSAPLRLIKGVVPNMINAKYGRIINISSIWGSVTKARRVSYTTSKTAINGLTRSLAAELSSYNILVNAISPGFVNTELTKENNNAEELKIIANQIPIQRLAEPEEIAEIVGFFGSDRNSYVTGQTIMVDGGYTCL